jgi:hypothetical protein
MDTTEHPIRLGLAEDIPEPNGSDGDRADARLELINRYRKAAFDKPDPLEANLALINADLLSMAYQQQQMLERLCADCVDSPRKLELYRSGVDVHLRVDKQLEHNLQVEVRLGERRKAR